MNFTDRNYSFFRGFVIVLSLFLLAIFISCNEGGGGGSGDDQASNGDPDLTILEGTWFGTMIDETDMVYTITVTFDNDGNLVVDSVDGNPVGDTATLTKITSRMFRMLDSNNIEGMAVVDAQGLHLGWMDEADNAGVLQKNAAQLPVYDVSDINGQWRGEGFWCDADMNFLLDDIQSDMTVNDLAFSVQDNYNTDINGGFITWLPDYGGWRGRFNPNALGESGSFTVLLSADKNFAASISIDNANGPGICPQDYRYRFLNRQ
jgi:hypothetical protein